jgi:alpha/beta superfamily hydrolase
VAETRVSFPSATLCLEGRVEEQPGDAAAVLAAPHPLYGGTMDDAVVEALRTAYRSQGYTTLRFNYRGVGASEGTPGSDAGSCEDVVAALAYLAGRGKNRLDVAGYSFGAWAAFTAVQAETPAERAILVAPPIDHTRFEGKSEKVRLVVAPAEDHFASLPTLRRRVPHWSSLARLAVMRDANHYLMSKLDELVSIVREFLIDGR